MNNKQIPKNKNIKNILIKVSGDVASEQSFIDFATEKAKENYTVVICGAGTKISKELEDTGHDIKFDDNHGRITKTWGERQIVRRVLEEEERKLQNVFIGKGVVVEAPMISVGRVLCPINGDNYVKASYLGFDEIYVFTLNNRAEAKKKIFQDFPKIEIVGI